MNPRQRAKYLISEFEICTRPLFGLDEYDKELRYNKECALIVITEILNNPYNQNRDLSEALHDEYWEEVRKEINKL